MTTVNGPVQRRLMTAAHVLGTDWILDVLVPSTTHKTILIFTILQSYELHDVPVAKLSMVSANCSRVNRYGAQATTADYSHNYNSPMSPSALGTTASWYTDSNNTPKRRKDPTYFCQEDGCGKGFTAKHNLGYHTRGFHKGERPYLCGKCHKTFINLNDLKRHEKKCTTYP
ncbi:hypothetical protein MPER_08106 [Moniliophthora perniciosa FA553]|nr:hypothetical protein MPER_08106 [Moniliophthora perniciosa FA553]